MTTPMNLEASNRRYRPAATTVTSLASAMSSMRVRDTNSVYPLRSSRMINGPRSCSRQNECIEIVRADPRQSPEAGDSNTNRSHISKCTEPTDKTSQEIAEASDVAQCMDFPSQHVSSTPMGSRTNALRPEAQSFNYINRYQDSPQYRNIKVNPSIPEHQSKEYHDDPTKVAVTVNFKIDNEFESVTKEPGCVANIIAQSHVQYMTQRTRDSDEPVPKIAEYLQRYGVVELGQYLQRYQGSDMEAAKQIKFLQDYVKWCIQDRKDLTEKNEVLESKINGDELHCLEVLTLRSANLYPDVVKEILLRDKKLEELQRNYHISAEEMSLNPREDEEQARHREQVLRDAQKIVEARSHCPDHEAKRKCEVMRKTVHESYRTRIVGESPDV